MKRKKIFKFGWLNFIDNYYDFFVFYCVRKVYVIICVEFIA